MLYNLPQRVSVISMPKRMIDTDMWIDGQIIDDFEKNDIYLWLYLLTSPHTNICGVLKCSTSMIAFETKLKKEEIEKSITNLQDNLKIIKYNKQEEEVLILNWHKHNWAKSTTLFIKIKKEISHIKSIEFRNYIETLLQQKILISQKLFTIDKKNDKIYQLFNGKCAYCGKILDVLNYTIDHIKPKSQNGINNKSNYFPSCRECNLLKSIYNLDEFRIKFLKKHPSLSNFYFETIISHQKGECDDAI
ncbi:MAG: HNH endonuclease [Clostridia bacterium]|nr:HNH endonuclease [Clostridia bacterium]